MSIFTDRFKVPVTMLTVSFLLTAFFLTSCGGGTYGTGVTQTFNQNSEEKEDKTDPSGSSPEWLGSILGLSCEYNDLELSFSTELGPVMGDDSPQCVAEIPFQTQTVKAKIESSKKLPPTLLYSITRFDCKTDLASSQSVNGKLAVSNGEVTLPKLRWHRGEFFKVSLSLDTQTVSFALKREGDCK